MNHRASLTFALIACFGIFSARAEPPGFTEASFAPVSNPPPIQMLAPGFTVRELPLQLHNINNFAYAPDGRLFALCYDGNVLQLKDTDGDGLEDSVSCFYKNDSNEIPASIGMAWGPGGLYIASQKRIIRLRDKGDGTAELQTVTGGWVPPTGAAGSGLDAVGLAVDSKGIVYFGLGCDNWKSAYRVDKATGKSEYNLRSERGTIIKLSPDWKKREIIATGLRFTVSLAFNRNGDLFCTDQEGATWLPNGNPFDELLNIQPGRHYGFPPRHPTYLPNVIDEPSVFDYAPQHQSTCGLHFDEPTGGGASTFGPDWWRGDAIISGESRGKIWRTKLVKTPVGYVAQNNLIACLPMLTVDAIPTPQGDLLVTCHSGSPDWGTGPQGTGRLFKISYSDRSAPQPVFAYAASPTETRVVFDRPVDPTQFKNLAKQSTMTMGRYVTAGDRFESFRPGYQAVTDQQKLPRYDVPILSAGITPDNRTVVLQTVPRMTAANYAVKLPEGAQAERAYDTNRHELPQSAAIDVLSDLTGVEATWDNRLFQDKIHDDSSQTIWLPHFDLTVSRAFTAASAEHAHFFEMLKQRGVLILCGQLDLSLMLHPATQPGAKLDYGYPPEIVTVVVKSKSLFDFETTTARKIKPRKISGHEYQITTTPKPGAWLPILIGIHTGAGEPDLEISWFTDEDPRPRPFPLRRFFLPWAKPESAGPIATSSPEIPEIAGGDWERGKKVFFGERAACFKCHQVNGEGGRIGPDLSNLIYRDYASVLKDITQPSAAINPDHLAYNVEFKDGEMATGVIMDNTPTTLILGQANGQTVTFEKSKIASMKTSSLSLMPEGLLQNLSAGEQKDLLTYLLMPQPEEKK